MKNKELINKNYGRLFKENLLEQYKLYVNTSTDISSKRLESNKFHLTLNSVIFGLTSYLTILDDKLVILLLSIVGTLISLIWLRNILAYKELNSAKFKVIHQLENYLPASLFKIEEQHYLKKYHSLTDIEKFVPIIFIILYIAIITLMYWSNILVYLKM